MSNIVNLDVLHSYIYSHMKYIISTETFRDIFSTMNINNYRLTNTESLCHLVQTTKGNDFLSLYFQLSTKVCLWLERIGTIHIVFICFQRLLELTVRSGNRVSKISSPYRYGLSSIFLHWRNSDDCLSACYQRYRFPESRSNSRNVKLPLTKTSSDEIKPRYKHRCFCCPNEVTHYTC